MATAEHCLYAFEALAANLERREPMDLEDVQKSSRAYLASRPARPLLPAALRRVAVASSSPAAASTNASGASSPSSTSTLSLSADTPATSVAASAQGDDDEDGDPEVRESPLFVTWNVVTSRAENGSGGDDDGERALRGCIGTFEDQELAEGIASYAVTSALHDTRFAPVDAPEMPRLEVSVTLLTDFEDCADDNDWELGLHGLRIAFVHRGRRHGATYLPDVAVEQGWTKEETLVSLMRKAGWMGKRDRWREVPLDCVRYQGKKVSLGYAEFKAWRDWVDQTGWQG